jgi:hypothetical protein
MFMLHPHEVADDDFRVKTGKRKMKLLNFFAPVDRPVDLLRCSICFRPYLRLLQNMFHAEKVASATSALQLEQLRHFVGPAAAAHREPSGFHIDDVRFKIGEPCLLPFVRKCGMVDAVLKELSKLVAFSQPNWPCSNQDLNTADVHSISHGHNFGLDS